MSGAPPVRVAAVVLAAGSGTRLGAGRNKVLLELRGEPVLGWSLRTVRELDCVRRTIVVARAADHDDVRPLLRGEELVVGGAERHDSEWAALCALASDVENGEIDVVAIHDAARPMATAALWQDVIIRAQAVGGALPVRPLEGAITGEGVPVPDLVAVQTPQAFRAADLLAAYRRAEADGFRGTDTASCWERYSSLPIAGVPAPATNLKITFADDLRHAGMISPRPEGA